MHTQKQLAHYMHSHKIFESYKHIPPSNIIYLIELLKFNFCVACQPTIQALLLVTCKVSNRTQTQVLLGKKKWTEQEKSLTKRWICG